MMQLRSAESIRHSATTSSDVPHPYAVAIEPVTKPEGHFGWKLHRSGTLIERSDRLFTSEAKAFDNAMRAVEIDAKGGFSSRR